VVPFLQEVSGVYISPFLAKDELKMALRARKVSGAFEKRAPGQGHCIVLLGGWGEGGAGRENLRPRCSIKIKSPGRGGHRLWEKNYQ